MAANSTLSIIIFLQQIINIGKCILLELKVEGEKGAMETRRVGN